MEICEGSSFPLGVKKDENRHNFSIFSKVAKSITLCLFSLESDEPISEVPLKRENDIWSIALTDLPLPCRYAYIVEYSDSSRSPYLSDPYAKELWPFLGWGEKSNSSLPPLGILKESSYFDWEGVQKPKIDLQHLIIYEMHVRSFTIDPSSKVKSKGSFLGIIEKIPYLKKLGVNAIELMPIFYFFEDSHHAKKNRSGEALFNYWGYSPLNFFSVMNAYCDREHDLSPVEQFKTMVKELHANKIEVILDVVYNHTAEGKKGSHSPYNFRAIDEHEYYLMNKKGQDLNFSGCGNTFNANSPMGKKMILDSLEYWSEEMQVDGFRFDLASILTRDPKGTPLANPPLLNEIAKHPTLSTVKCIAEPWDAGGLYQIGYFPKWKNWSEWNGKYRDALRRFLKGMISSSSFADYLAGSHGIYGKYKTPLCSINFVTAHDGFTLHDLVTYFHKHNEENGEHNRDGSDHNDSWNYGEEGETEDPIINQIRTRQKKNFLTILFFSRGVPMLLMGDEYGHTRGGNNNAWCLDNEKNWFLWNQLEENEELFHFVKNLIELRKKYSILHKNDFFRKSHVQWHGTEPHYPKWEWDGRFLSCTISNEKEHFYLGINSYHDDLTIDLPKLHEKKWYPKIQTHESYPLDFIDHPKEAIIEEKVSLPSYSIILLEAF